MQSISAPSDFKSKKKPIKAIAIIGVVCGAILITTLAIVFRPTAQQITGFTFKRINLYAMDNTTNSITLQFEFEYRTTFSSNFKLNAQNIELQMQNKSKTTWQTIGTLQDSRKSNISRSTVANLTALLVVSNSNEDSLKRMFLGEIIQKSEFTIRLIGEFAVSDKEDSSLPDLVQMDINVLAVDFFGYGTNTFGPSIFKLVDLITPGTDPLQPTKFLLKCLSNYKNALNFSLKFLSYYAVVYNRTETGQLLTLNLNSTDLEEIGPMGNKNFSMSAYVDPNQLSWLVSDLLSNRTDVIKFKNVMSVVQIGKVNITFVRLLENMASDLKFASKIANYYVEGLALFLDVEFVNPCGLIFNLTAIDLDMYVSGTQQKVVWIDKTLFVPVTSYNSTRVNHIQVNADVNAFVQHSKDLFDLIGTLTAQSFNFDGTIPFTAYGTKIL